MILKRRKLIRIISYLIALCVVFTASGVFSAMAKSDYESTLEGVRLNALASLAEYSREISSGLRLLAVSTDTALTDSSAYVGERAVGATASLACFNSEKVYNLNRFFSRLYDFIEEFSGTEESRRCAVRLSDYAQEIYCHLSDLTNAVINGQYSLTEYKSIYRKNTVPYFENELDYYNGNEEQIFEMNVPAVSDTKDFEFLADKDTVSVESAKQKASELTGVRSAIWRNVHNDGESVCYSFVCGNIRVDVSKAGGIVYKIINPQPCRTAVCSSEEATNKAADFLEACGFENMRMIYDDCSGYTASFVFVPEVNGVLLMTAKTEIEICLASGKTTYFDASEYIKSFRTDISAPDIVCDVRESLPFGLVARETHICIDNIKGRERLCILAICPFEDENVYIFVDYYNRKTIKTLIA